MKRLWQFIRWYPWRCEADFIRWRDRDWWPWNAADFRKDWLGRWTLTPALHIATARDRLRTWWRVTRGRILIGDGIADDTRALNNALRGKNVFRPNGEPLQWILDLSSIDTVRANGTVKMQYGIGLHTPKSLVAGELVIPQSWPLEIEGVPATAKDRA